MTSSFKTHITSRLIHLGWTFALAASALIGVVLLVAGIVAGFMVLFWIGIPLTIISLGLVRIWATWQRRLLCRSVGTKIEDPKFPIVRGSWDRKALHIIRQAVTWRTVAWLGINSTLGLALYSTLLIFFFLGLYLALMPLLYHFVLPDTWQNAFTGLGVLDFHSTLSLAVSIPVGVLLFAAWWHWGIQLVTWYSRIARVLLGPTSTMQLAQRVDELSESRADTVEAAATELRRIERDLHDGAQARLVALAIHLGMAEEVARTSPDAVGSMIGHARTESQAILADIRNLVRGIHPPVLADRGLSGALQAMALAHPVATTVVDRVDERLPAPVESAIYFAANEVLTNVTKHARARRITMVASIDGPLYKLEITDDGHGGATVRPGGGLEGVRRRLGAFDGHIKITSPSGGPTAVVMVIPCVSSHSRNKNDAAVDTAEVINNTTKERNK